MTGGAIMIAEQKENLQEVRGDGYDIFLGSPSVVYNEDRSEDHSQKKKGSQYATG